jgi:hypothetical protein
MDIDKKRCRFFVKSCILSVVEQANSIYERTHCFSRKSQALVPVRKGDPHNNGGK